MKVAIMGYGVVGSGVAEVLSVNAAHIAEQVGEPVELKYILDLREFPGDPNAGKVVHDFETILNDPEIRIVAEAMGGINPAYDFTKQLLQAGKSVVSSNKELVAEHGAELLKLAKENNTNYFFEASVGGGVPIIRPLSQCLAANEIEEFAGILNGTTNFILTKMYHEDMSLEEALALAQQYGYAEKDPTADVCGHDVCRKVCILASISFGKHVYPKQVSTEGIENLSLRDMSYAKSAGNEIKLLGMAKRLPDGKISALVCPVFISGKSQLAGVQDVFNGILVRGNMVGDVVFFGQGAGKLPTASAVSADILECARHLKTRKAFGWEEGREDYVADHKTLPTAYYVRGIGCINAVKEVMGDVQFLSLEGAPANEVAFITKPETESVLDEKLDSIQNFNVKSKIRAIPYESV